MRRNRRNLLVLLIVVLLVAVSGLVVAKEPTRLGLDLKGGVELVYQATPTGQTKEVSGNDIDRSIEIIRERIDELGVAEPEVSQAALVHAGQPRVVVVHSWCQDHAPGPLAAAVVE